MKKNLLTLLVAASLVASMAACGGNDAANNDAANTEVVNTEVETETDVNTETQVETETEAVTEVADGLPAFSCDWICTITFNEDGTYVFDLADYQIKEEGTWAIANGVLTVTKPSGNTCETVIEDGVCKLNYVADASEQLVGQFYTSDYAFLGAEEVTASAPVMSCDWICTITFNEDGTYAFDLADYQIKEEGTWAMDAEGVITVTKPSGNTCVSYIGEDGLVHLDYVADASEQLVGQFYIAE